MTSDHLTKLNLWLMIVYVSFVSFDFVSAQKENANVTGGNSNRATCLSGYWKCNSGQCIPRYNLCDRDINCPDRSDEANCTTTTKRPTTTKSTTTRVKPITTTKRSTTSKSTTTRVKPKTSSTTKRPTTSSTTKRPNRECGSPAITPISSNSRIVGGVPARPHSWPWQVSIKMRTYLDNYIHYCGGSIINETTILTAAHCMFYESKMVSKSDFFIVAGDYDLAANTEATTQSKKVDWFKIHDKFIDDLPYPNDIAIVILKTPLQFNDHVSPICLPSSSIQKGQDCYATGWGETKNTGVETTLNQARVPIIALAACQKLTYYTLVVDTMICAGYLAGGVDTCSADSGGPLVCKAADNKWYLDGITSWGEDCAEKNQPGVYTRVYSFLDWIRKTTGFVG